MSLHSPVLRPHSINSANSRHDSRLRYLPGLDGLRALAVLAVFIYHAAPAWLPGGFLGVDVFFVISGYLITALLLAEWRERGSIDLRVFWLRRARRLLPALFLVLLVTMIAVSLFLPGEVTRLRGDTLAALGYVTNWYLVFGHQSYFVAIGRPSFLQHLWSLAVEEQFYLLWPLLFIGIMRSVPRLATPIILLGAVASTGWMAYLYHPAGDPSRLYYGTDTRAAGLLVGAALAMVWPLRSASGGLTRRFILALDVAGIATLVALAGFCLRVGQYQPFLYRGGFLVVAVVTAVIIAAVAVPESHLGRNLLGVAPLRWLGLRSYGIYLWHWPVLLLTRAHVDVPLGGLPLLLLQLVATIVLAEVSYRWVELPVRGGLLLRGWRALRSAGGQGGDAAHLRWVAGIGVFLGFLTVMGVDVVMARPPAPPSYLAASSIHDLPATGAVAAPAVVAPFSSEEVGAALTRLSAIHVRSASAVGDSVMLGSAQALRELVPKLTIDAEVGRQPGAAVTTVRDLSSAGELGDAVVVQVGNNGPFDAQELNDLLRALGNERRVFVVNLRVPRPWESANNEVLAAGIRRHPNAVLVDWHSASAGHPEFFRDDGVHLLPAGARVYTSLIALQLYTDDLVTFFAGR